MTSEMDATGSVAAVEAALGRLGKTRDELEALWDARKLRLDLCLRLRLFERDALEVSSQLDLWSEQLQRSETGRDATQAEALLRLHNESVGRMQATTFAVLQQGQELAQAFETSGLALMADSQYSAQTRVQVLLEFLHEREMDLEDLAELRRVKLEQCLQLCQFQTDANQVNFIFHSKYLSIWLVHNYITNSCNKLKFLCVFPEESNCKYMWHCGVFTLYSDNVV